MEARESGQPTLFEGGQIGPAGERGSGFQPPPRPPGGGIEAPPGPEDDDPPRGLGDLALPRIHSGLSLVDARLDLASVLHEGSTCPCCDQNAQVYRWSLYATAVRLLAALYREGGTTRFVESRTVKGKGQGDASRLRFWGLAEQETERRPDGGKSGYWRVTSAGEEYLRGAPVARYVWVYNGRVLIRSRETRTIHDALGVAFSFEAMMRGEF